MSLLKPNKPPTFDGTRDAFTVRTWLHSVGRYISLIQVGSDAEISDKQAIDFASTFMTGVAANWWFTVVNGAKMPDSREAFSNLVIQEFVPQDSAVRARDKLSKLKQKTSVSAYLSEFRNIVINIQDMSEGEKLARFCEGLKSHILLDVRKNNPSDLDAAANIALSVDGAYYGAGFYTGKVVPSSYSGYAPMEIGNFEKSHSMNAQKRKDIRENLCFVCHKPGCRAYRHKGEVKKRLNTNNTQVHWGAPSSFPQEN